MQRDGFQLLEQQLQDEMQFYQLQPTAQGVQRQHSVSGNIPGFFPFELHLLHLTLRGQMGSFRGLRQNKDSTKL